MKFGINYIFKKIDGFVFSQIDRLKDSQAYTQATDALNMLDENLRKFVNLILVAVPTLIPLVIVFFLFISNFNLRSDIDLKRKIFNLGNDILSTQRSLKSSGNEIFSNSIIENHGAFNNRVRSVSNGIGIKLDNLGVTNFQSKEKKPPIVKTTATVTFKDLTLLQITKLLNQINKKEKMTISNIEISKNKNTNLLSGEFAVVHFARRPTL